MRDEDRAAVLQALNHDDAVWREQLERMPIRAVVSYLHTLGYRVVKWERGQTAPLPACCPRLADEDE